MSDSISFVMHMLVIAYAPHDHNLRCLNKLDPCHEKTCFLHIQNVKELEHKRNLFLIYALVIHSVCSPKVKLVYVLINWLKTLHTGFLMKWLKFHIFEKEHVPNMCLTL